MSFVGKLFAKITGAEAQGKAAQQAAGTQAAAAQEGIGAIKSESALGQSLLQGLSQMGINELRDYFGVAQDALVGGQQRVDELANPLINAGRSAIDQQLALTGAAGPAAQQAAIAAISGSPEMAAMQQQGEQAILQNASATGGLRGGNTQGALAQFRPALLSQLINQRYQQLGGLSGLGVAGTQLAGGAALQTGQGLAQGALQTGQGIAGNALQTGITGAGLAANTGASIAQMLQQQGAATAGGQLAMGSVARTGFSDLLKIGATLAAAGGAKGLLNSPMPSGGL